ncbi:MAG: hypothetical protein KTR25_09570 [Myxococcales bacterium]|nr:hypothetical protein [Myxococcales bacterium]
MKTYANEAPIFVDSFALAEWLLGRVQESCHPLAPGITEAAVELIELVALALSGQDKIRRLQAMDELLVRLRMRIRLATATGLFDRSQALFVAERLDLIGNHLGGWLHVSENNTWQQSE